jgi:hypothetical protein
MDEQDVLPLEQWSAWARAEVDRIRREKGLPPCTFESRKHRRWREVMESIEQETELPDNGDIFLPDPPAPILLPPVTAEPLRENDVATAVDLFRERQCSGPGWQSEIRKILRGANLACFCPLCPKHQDGRPWNEPCPDCPPCHADVLLEIANS